MVGRLIFYSTGSIRLEFAAAYWRYCPNAPSRDSLMLPLRRPGAGTAEFKRHPVWQRRLSCFINAYVALDSR